MRIHVLSRNIAANAITTGIITVFQVVSVPIFLKYWGVVLYGEWITLNTLTAYFQITDVGLNTATANSLTFSYTAGELERCNRLLNNNIFFIVLAFTILLVALALLIALGAFSALFHFSVMSARVVNAALILLCAQVFVGTLNNLLSGIYRATSNFARGVMVDNFIRIAEYGALLGGVMAKLSIPLILAAVVGVKLIGLCSKYIDARKFYRFPISVGLCEYAELKRMWAPSLSFFLFPVANSLALQGPVVLINFFMGSAAVVVFNTTRVLINFARSVVDIVQRSVWPEMSLAYGNHNLTGLRRLHRSTVLSSLAVVVAMAALFTIVGKPIYEVWTGHHLAFNTTLFYLLLLALATNTLWTSSGILLQAINKHQRLAVLYVGAAALCVGVAYVLLRFVRQVSVVPIAYLVCDLLMITYVLERSLRQTNDSLGEMRAAVVRKGAHVRRALSGS